MNPSVNRRTDKHLKPFGIRRERGDPRKLRRTHLVRHHQVGEAPGYSEGDAVLLDRTVSLQRLLFQLPLQRRPGRHQLSFNPLHPRFELNFRRPQVALVVKLHGFFAGGQRQADQAQRAQALSRFAPFFMFVSNAMP